MSAVHVLDGDSGRYRVVIHFPVPNGNNQAGVSWKAALVGAGRNTTVLSEGVGAGQISTAEKAQILSGDVIEVQTELLVESGGATAASLDDMIGKAVATAQAELARKYRYFGFTRG